LRNGATVVESVAGKILLAGGGARILERLLGCSISVVSGLPESQLRGEGGGQT